MAALLALPLLFSPPPKRPMPQEPVPPIIDWPRVYSGDEPHYLVMLNSLLLDGDLNLKNNYDSVHAGSWQAGRAFAWSALDHHTYLYMDEKLWGWHSLMERGGAQWSENADGSLNYLTRSDLSIPAKTLEVEKSQHPVAVAYMLAPFTYPFRNIQGAVESVSIILSSIMTFAAAIALRAIFMSMVNNATSANMASALVFLGSPLWLYGRTIFNEPFIASFVTIAYALVIEKGKRSWIRAGAAGLFFGLAIALKPPAALLALPVFVVRLFRRDFKSIFYMALGPILGICALFAQNYWITGSAFAPYNKPEFINPLIGLTGNLLSPSNGLLFFAPICLLLPYGWYQLWKMGKREAFMGLLGVISYIVFMSSLSIWSGNTCYGPRYLVATLPLLFVGLIPVIHSESQLTNSSFNNKWIFGLASLSILINLISVLPTHLYWNTHPLYKIFQLSFL
jgi:hypothetical protein